MNVYKPRFFNWVNYPATQAPEITNNTTGNYPVVITGGGPVGLTLALTLAQQGLPVVLLELKDQVSDSSRTLAVARRSVQVLDRLGLANTFSKKAIKRERNFVYHGTQLIHSAPYEQSPEEKHPDISVLQQPWTEQILLDAVLAHPLIDLRWLSKVTNVTPNDEGSLIEVVSSEGAYTLQARYLVAADGARGQVRRSLGLEYEEIGDGVLQRHFIICDFELPSDLPIARRLWICPPYRPKSAVILHRQPFDTWRLDYALEDDEDIEEAMKPENVAANVRAQLELMNMPDCDNFRLVWISSYRPMSRSLRSYRHKNIFFAGDAAHQTPIFGGRGMNQGMLDAANLGWKLGMVLKGLASEALLDSYDSERRPLIIENLKDISLATLCMTAPSRGASLMRKAVFDLVPTELFALKLVDAFNAKKTDYLFPGTPPESTHTALPGFSLPDCRILLNGAPAYLHDLLKPNAFTSLHFSANGEMPEALHETLKLAVSELGDHFKAVSVGLMPASSAATRIADQNGLERLGLNEGSWMLVRPDGYIQARSEHPGHDTIINALHQALGRH